ncbi:MAG: 30S ribosome-binding factor RbfA [Rubricoccaceae bacterium]
MSIRTERVARMIQREVADLLQNDFYEASQSLLTLTGARMTRDLGIVYLDVSILGDTPEGRQAAFRRLEAQTPQIRQALAQRIRHQVRRIPEVRFFLDEGPQRSARMDALFEQIRADRGQDAGALSEDADEPTQGRGDY